MTGFNFEKNLDHQSKAVKSVIGVFDGIEILQPQEIQKQIVNPLIDKTRIFGKYYNNIKTLQNDNNVERNLKSSSNIIDIMMETGTGKTYTYAKTIFELNKNYGIFKFVVVVPTLPIKAGTINFLKSDNSIGHFKEQYNKIINLHIVESQRSNKSKKSFLPTAINNFVNAGNFDKNQIQVMIINSGMLNSETMEKVFDRHIFDNYSIAFEAIAAIKPFVIIDEPHKFDKKNKSWENIQKMKPQFILRYGATFTENENLVYKLSAVDSFNKNLVKGIIAHISEFEAGKNALLKFVNSTGKEANFELSQEKSEKNDKKKSYKITVNENFGRIHQEMADLKILKMKKTEIDLSNGLTLKKGDKINPYSYSETLQESMIAKAIKKHFELEKEFLKRDIKIKPLTLFFIDNIEEYRGENGNIKKLAEKYIKAECEKLLKDEKDGFYKKFLQTTLKDISLTHGGYFAKDKSGKKENFDDESIAKEVEEILHDKEKILSLDNPRRFIFSKWTLREGWDNPNVFQICKLRSSGSDISKLQEVGRGLRLPVNEYGNRVKDEQFYLNYFVDFTENDFVEKLKNEINNKSGAISIEDNQTRLDEKMIKLIVEKYNIEEEKLLEKLDENEIIKRNNDFKDGGFDYIKKHYPMIFEGIDENKISDSKKEKKKIRIRQEKYSDLKDLWEKINQKVILEYKIKNEEEFKVIFKEFLSNYVKILKEGGLKNKEFKLEADKNEVFFKETVINDSEISKISTIDYDNFLTELAVALNLNIKTIHQAFVEAKISINQYLNSSTIRILKEKFNNYLLFNAIDRFGIEYQKITNSIHPTKLTNKKGEIKKEIDSSQIGVLPSKEIVANNYFFEELFFDSELEKENIIKNIEEVIVFSKIPKNSIKIPVAGAQSYSPDFAYVLNCKDGASKLHFIVETKNSDQESLRESEKRKILYAEEFFGNAIKIRFESQFKGVDIADLIKEILSGRNLITKSNTKNLT